MGQTHKAVYFVTNVGAAGAGNGLAAVLAPFTLGKDVLNEPESSSIPKGPIRLKTLQVSFDILNGAAVSLDWFLASSTATKDKLTHTVTSTIEKDTTDATKGVLFYDFNESGLIPKSTKLNILSHIHAKFNVGGTGTCWFYLEFEVG